MKKPARKFKTTVVDDPDRVDPQIRTYVIVRSVFSVAITVVLYSVLRWCGMSELWAVTVAVAACTANMIKADTKQFGNRFTVTRYDELTPDTPTRFKDRDGKTLTIKDVLPS